MNVIGVNLTVLESTDPSKRGMSGVVLLETAKTVLISTNEGTKMVEKRGSVFQLSGSEKVITGADIPGRLEDRWGSIAR